MIIGCALIIGNLDSVDMVKDVTSTPIIAMGGIKQSDFDLIHQKCAGFSAASLIESEPGIVDGEKAKKELKKWRESE